ncbi:MAG: hypothetical protein AB1529_07740 [Candidatus Micrarchaeota archaeon]
MATRGRKAGAAESGAGNVVDLAEFRKLGAGMHEQGMLTREDCLKMLRNIAPLDQELAGLLGLPERMFLIDAGGGSQPSLSSEPGNDISGVAGHLLRGLDFPAAVPDFGIIISSQGGNAFCTLLDKKRKIIVCSPVRNAFADEGSWVSFAADLKDALKHARYLAERGDEFNFAMVSDGMLSSC